MYIIGGISLAMQVTEKIIRAIGLIEMLSETIVVWNCRAEGPKSLTEYEIICVLFVAVVCFALPALPLTHHVKLPESLIGQG